MLKIPEGATHAAADGRFYKLEGEWFYSNYMGYWKRHWSGEPEGAYLLSPATRPIWNGPQDGLPPVGMTVRIPKAVAHHDYVKRFAGREVLIVAHAADSQGNAGRVAVFQCKMDDGFNEYHGLTADRGNFEPIRTAEQLAAEEREAQIRKMEEASRPHIGSSITRVICERLYDGGARMPGEGSKS